MKKKVNTASKAKTVVTYVTMYGLAFLTLVPFLWMILTSLKDNELDFCLSTEILPIRVFY